MPYSNKIDCENQENENTYDDDDLMEPGPLPLPKPLGVGNSVLSESSPEEAELNQIAECLMVLFAGGLFLVK